jgi:rod shape-determining protein MreD
MSWFAATAALTVMSVIEAASHNYIKLLGVSPELVLTGVLFFALNSDRRKGALYGLIAGLLKMSFTGMHPLIMLLYGCVGFAAGMYKEALYRHLASAQMILAAIAVMCTSIVYDMVISSKGFPYYKAVIFLSVPAAAYTAVIAPLVFKVLEFMIPPVELDYREIVFKKKVYEGRRPQ